MDSAMGTAFIFLARSAIERIPKDELEDHTRGIQHIIGLYLLGTQTLPEKKALIELHQHANGNKKLVFDQGIIDSARADFESMTGPRSEIDDSSSTAASEDEDDDEEGEDDDRSVFPPGLEKASDVPGVSNAWGFRCELCGHICVQTRHFYAHFKEGRGVAGLRIFRAIKAELVWWAKDPEGNEYTGELVELTEKPMQPPIPAPCGNQIRAANNERHRIRRAKAAAKRNVAAGQKGVAGTKGKRAQSQGEAE
ncbi:uncharacterized protein A1O9_11574 [Exophiala aquamarina CBS 119918]|uniref:Uncharacterized protein n=1 Tax=Exophiala aquamarina CBS 119918 TaxID=1182545 RepID=A0A072NWW1_9EURO|nr:uncharacterized protein A1O9_11574 [Exophiala aquamarina CBS 119918]KEF52334.1 hypothetical protein A1O9_11574 [Exophiala aquamarina CBS 119918]